MQFDLLAIVGVLLFCVLVAVLLYLKARALARQVFANMNSLADRLEALGTDVGTLRHQLDRRLTSVGTAVGEFDMSTGESLQSLGRSVGELRNSTGATLQSLGTSIGELRNSTDSALHSLGTAVGELRHSVDLRFTALGLAVAQSPHAANVPIQTIGARLARMDSDLNDRLEAVGTALGHLGNNVDHRLESLGLATGLARRDLETLSSLTTTFAYGSERKLDHIQHGLTAMAYRLGMASRPADIALGLADNDDSLCRRWSVFDDTRSKTRVPARKQDGRTATIVTLGQSNAANHGEGRYAAARQVLNFNVQDGHCYHAADPLLGASGDGGNFATRFGDIVLHRGLFERLVIAPIAIAGSTVQQWAEEGIFNRRILLVLRRLCDAGLAPDFIFWQQGEGNRGAIDPDGLQYRKNLLEIVGTFRSFGINAPFFVALAGKDGSLRGDAEQYVRLGQLAAINPLIGTYRGPDTDTIGPEHRIDSDHLRPSGQDLLAGMWADVLATFLQGSGHCLEEKRRHS